jgi:hypothetical protein
VRDRRSIAPGGLEEDDKGFKPLCLDERGNTPAGKRIRSR